LKIYYHVPLYDPTLSVILTSQVRVSAT